MPRSSAGVRNPRFELKDVITQVRDALSGPVCIRKYRIASASHALASGGHFGRRRHMTAP
eukprot:6192409-Pleurochrysis_carterae.AAC.5